MSASVSDVSASSTFRKISYGVSMATPILGQSPTASGPKTSANATATSPAPDLILVVSWMAAPPRHVRSYIAEYQVRYPSATIIHIATSQFDAACRSNTAKRRDMKPVVEAIKRLQKGPPRQGSRPQILLHLFSNGGAYATAQLAIAYRERTGAALPVMAIILDSTPGRATFSLTLRAMQIGLAPAAAPVRIIGTMLVTVGLVFYFALQYVGIIQNAVEVARRVLNNKELVSASAPRRYVYSKSDELVLWQDVEDHCLEAEAAGIVVSRVLFEGTGHVGHVRLHRDKYWSAVEELWASAVSQDFQ